MREQIAIRNTHALNTQVIVADLLVIDIFVVLVAYKAEIGNIAIPWSAKTS